MLNFLLSMASTALKPHLALEKPHVAALVDKWMPQQVNGNLVSVSGVEPYVRAKIAMLTADGGLLSEKHDLFIVNHVDGGMVLRTCLWGPDSCQTFGKVDAFRSLLQWHNAVEPNATIVDNLLSDQDSEDWFRAQMWYAE